MSLFLSENNADVDGFLHLFHSLKIRGLASSPKTNPWKQEASWKAGRAKIQIVNPINSEIAQVRGGVLADHFTTFECNEVSWSYKRRICQFSDHKVNSIFTEVIDHCRQREMKVRNNGQNGIHADHFNGKVSTDLWLMDSVQFQKQLLL